jgi:hypothetical protein
MVTEAPFRQARHVMAGLAETAPLCGWESTDWVIASR